MKNINKKNVTKNKIKCSECCFLFKPSSNSQKTCSESCKKTRTNRLTQPRKYNLTCKECNKNFVINIVIENFVLKNATLITKISQILLVKTVVKNFMQNPVN